MKKRIISALIMLLIFIPILILGDVYYPILCSILGLVGLWELMRLEKNIPDYMKFISYFIGLFLIVYNYRSLSFEYLYNYAIIVIVFFIYAFSIIISRDKKKYTYKEALWLVLAVFLIGILFNSLIRIRTLGIYYVLYCFIVSATTDTFAYLGGSMLGHHKLAPSISPNKTIEGSIIGSVFGVIAASLFYYFVIGGNLLEIIILSFVLTLLAQLGDLFFSSIKRYYKIKDYSDIIPGHGGILDRLDSILFVILGFLVYINIV